jgi:3-hydroxymyristoyl/3-hydroxydecanoyl-(acyl carrier protein) dehydratase
LAVQSAELFIRVDEPAADGHFPGNPIVPGAVLLREVLHLLSPDREATCCEIRSAKFSLPVRPGDRLTVRWDARAAGDVLFTCTAGAAERRVLSGTIRMRAR